MSGLELFFGTGDKLDDRLRAVAQGETLVSLVKDYTAEARTAVEDSIREVQAATGTAFTARLDGVTAVLTDPQPKPRVTDPVAFAAWATAHTKLEHQTIERVEVVDHAAAIEALTGARDPVRSIQEHATDQWHTLRGALRVVSETVLPSDALDQLAASGVITVDEDGCRWVDKATGEVTDVPGVAVSTARQTLQVRIDKDAKAAAKRQLVEALGLPPIDDGGGQR